MFLLLAAQHRAQQGQGAWEGLSQARNACATLSTAPPRQGVWGLGTIRPDLCPLPSALPGHLGFSCEEEATSRLEALPVLNSR